jgi:hypothetical protein
VQKGKISLRSLCEITLELFQRKKRESIPVSVIAEKFNIDEQWILRNQDRFEFMRNETIDFCLETLNEVLRNSAPEKSWKLHFWIGWVIGILTVVAFVLFQMRQAIQIWLR